MLSYALKDSCLFELWNTEVWDPGAELSWNVTSPKKVPYLKHDATLVEFDPAQSLKMAAPPTTAAPPAPTTAASPMPRVPPVAPSGNGSTALTPAIEFSNPLVPRGAEVILQDGTPLRMRLTRNLSSSDAQAGDRVDFEVLDEVRVGNTLVIASGATAIATITDSEAKRSMGRAGRLDVTLDYVRAVDGDKIRLSGVQDTKAGGHTGAMTGAMVATAVVFWPAAPLFLFMKGKDVKIPKGHEVTVYVNSDQQVRGLAPAVVPVPVRDVEKSEKPVSKPVTGKPMTDEDVLTLKTAGFGDDFIIVKIKTSPSGYSLDTPDLVRLKQAGLSDSVIGAMVQAASSK